MLGTLLAVPAGVDWDGDWHTRLAAVGIMTVIGVMLLGLVGTVVFFAGGDGAGDAGEALPPGGETGTPDHATDTPTGPEDPDDPTVTTSPPDETTSDPPSEDYHIDRAQVDVEGHHGPDDIEFEVLATFEGRAELTVRVSDGGHESVRTVEAHNEVRRMIEIEDEIGPPRSLKDGERFTVTFVLRVDGQVYDRTTVTGRYEE